MKKFTKITAAVTAISLAATATGCTPTLGKGTETALTIDGYDVRAGIFVYYTLQAYNEAVSSLSTSGSTLTPNDVKKSNIDGVAATDWIQNRAVEYCRDFVAVEKEFDQLGITLTDEDKADFDQIVSYYTAQTSNADNGVGEESISAVLLNSIKLDKVFEYYYGPGGTKGMTDEELRDYYVENNARVKCIYMTYKDADGNDVSDETKKEIRELADSYATQINAESSTSAKLKKVDELSEEYDEYAATLTTTVSGETTTETTTTTTTTTTADSSSTETTTTDPYANEYIMPKNTTTTVDASTADPTTTTTTPSEDTINFQKFNDYVFNDLALDKAVVYEYDDESIVVIIKEDITERMNEDDLWSEDNVKSLVQDLFYTDYSDYLEEVAKNLTVEKNTRAFRKFSPFKLKLESK